MRHPIILTAWLAAVPIVLGSCAAAVVRKDIRNLSSDSSNVTMTLPMAASPFMNGMQDTASIAFPEEDELILAGDSSGIPDVILPLKEIVITARSANVAERNGRIRAAFDINVPEDMVSPQWQIQLTPSAVMMDDTIALESIYVTGRNYRARQIRGYELYRRYLSGILTDSSEMIHAGLLEIFIERNIPELGRLKNDSSFVDPSKVRGLYGITFNEAKEHYLRHMSIRRNNRLKEMIPQKYRKYVKAPLATDGVRLDSIADKDSEGLVYSYVQDLDCRPGLKKIEIIMDGSIFYEGKPIYTLPSSSPLVFVVSSLSSLAVDTTIYLTKVIERKVMASTYASVSFRPGEYVLDENYSGNKAEIEHIESILYDLDTNGELVADSLVITASCSPEGRYSFNKFLADKRSASITEYLSRLDTRIVRKYNPENWERLVELIKDDSTLTERGRLLRICNSGKDFDKRESLLSGHPQYQYIKDNLYPILREVLFEFHMHRRDMAKDTIHTTVPDTTYSNGLAALKNMDYGRAAARLGRYRDINSALAFLAAEYNASALKVLLSLPSSARREYLLAIAYLRNGNGKRAADAFLKAVELDPSLKFRGSLDPEINGLIEKYGLYDKIFM